MSSIETGKPELGLKIECRRTLHLHAIAARRNVWSAEEWTEWARRRASALIGVLGEHEFECIIKVVWGLK